MEGGDSMLNDELLNALRGISPEERLLLDGSAAIQRHSFPTRVLFRSIGRAHV